MGYRKKGERTELSRVISLFIKKCGNSYSVSYVEQQLLNTFPWFSKGKGVRKKNFYGIIKEKEVGMENVLFVLNIVGIVAFAISGAMKGMKYSLDILGVVVLGILTALGGGMVRDVLLNQVPMALLHENDLGYAIVASVMTYFFGKRIQNVTSWVRYFDALGLAVFTVVGAEKGIQASLGILGVVIMGTSTGVVGGMLRDILVSEIPSVLKEEIYASFCIVGSMMYYFLFRFGVSHLVTLLVVVCFIFVGRVLAIRYDWHLPRRSL
ncbi:Putative inner membrane protein [Brevinematales bacterium NS]|nr:Putative inner membrane protein [Brevinematales bacterium NS]